MELYVLLFCISVIWFCLAAFFKRKPSKNLPPGPAGFPILGSLPHLGHLPHQKLAEWAKQYGPLMTVHFGFKTTVVASNAEVAKEILQKNDLALSFSRADVDVMSAIPYFEGLIGWVPADEKWRYKRRICSSSLFSKRQVDSLQYLCDQKIEKLLGHVQKHCDMGTEVDIGQLAFATILNLVSNSIFSTDLVGTNFESAGKFKDLIWRIMEVAGRSNISDSFPMLKKYDLQGLKRSAMHSYSSLYEIFDELIERRLKARACSEKRYGDLLDVLLDECQKEGSDFNRLNIKAMILELFFAGSDTSSITIEWAMAELLRNPNEMQKAKEELVEVMGNQSSILKQSDIEKLPYLQAIFKETLRLHPAGPLLIPRIAGCDVEIKGYTIKKGTQVIVNAWAICRDPNYWDDPISFKPKRFLNSNVDFRGKDFEYIPFGAGRRICPGWPLASRMVTKVLAAMMHSFNWKLPNGITNERLDMEENFGLTLRKNVPLRVIPTSR